MNTSEINSTQKVSEEDGSWGGLFGALLVLAIVGLWNTSYSWVIPILLVVGVIFWAFIEIMRENGWDWGDIILVGFLVMVTAPLGGLGIILLLLFCSAEGNRRQNAANPQQVYQDNRAVNVYQSWSPGAHHHGGKGWHVHPYDPSVGHSHGH